MKKIYNLDKNDKEKSKKKSLIAQRIVIGSIIAMELALSSSILYLNRFNNKMDTLIKKQENLYQEFIDSSQFSDHFKQEVEKISNDYTCGEISYDEFDDKLEYLTSIENSKKDSNLYNMELKSEIESLDKQKKDLINDYKSSIIPVGSLAVALVGGMGFASGVLLQNHYDDKNSKIFSIDDYELYFLPSYNPSLDNNLFNMEDKQELAK